jgi:hypothetical protein
VTRESLMLSYARRKRVEIDLKLACIITEGVETFPLPTLLPPPR